mmetsp:Transcript_59/g.195  ORF Transcript_59/g.195 Transcript_59/m.195 type:complete len:245 (-) Transcript_59:642-1376(-)
MAMRRSDSVALPNLFMRNCFCLVSFSILTSAAASRRPVCEGERERATEAESRRVLLRSDGTREPDRSREAPRLAPPSTSMASSPRRLGDLPRSSPSGAGTRAVAFLRKFGSAAASVSMPIPDRCDTIAPTDLPRALTLRGSVGWLAERSRRAVALMVPFFFRMADASLATLAWASASSCSIEVASSSSAASAARSSSSLSSSSSLASMSGSMKSAMFLPSMISGIMSSAHSGRPSDHWRCRGKE